MVPKKLRRASAHIEEVEKELPPNALQRDPDPRVLDRLIDAVRRELVQEFNKTAVQTVYTHLKAGQDPNHFSIAGFTPLALAAASGSKELVALLMEHRADVTISSVEKAEMPLHLAVRGGHNLVCQMLAEDTRRAGKIDQPNVTGWTPLQLAVASQAETSIAILLRARAAVDGRNPRIGGITPLHIASGCGFQEIAETLLAWEADPNALTDNFRGPLHFAAARADAPLVSLLLRSRADPSGGGLADCKPLELVPRDHPSTGKVSTLFAAYTRETQRTAKFNCRFD